MGAAVLTVVLALAWSWLGPPPPDGPARWQWPQYAPRPPAFAATDPSLGPARLPYSLPQTLARPQGQGVDR